MSRQSHNCTVCSLSFASRRYLERHGATKRHRHQEHLLRVNPADCLEGIQEQITKRFCTTTTNLTVTQSSPTTSTAVTSSHDPVIFSLINNCYEEEHDDFHDHSALEKMSQWNEYYEEDDVSLCADDEDVNDETLSPSNDWYPFKDEHYAELACLLCAPRPLGETNLKYIWYLLQKRDMTTPSLYQVKQHLADLPGKLEPTLFVDTKGQEYYSLSVIDIIRTKMATPSTSGLLSHYPKLQLIMS
ncbi:uncharacterized protein [Ptychodera flava]|uniref:uncharacterized protein n=1 Tax=Ptychodera flava TaxID=63121 RepID=UPI00396A2FFF